MPARGVSLSVKLPSLILAGKITCWREVHNQVNAGIRGRGIPEFGTVLAEFRHAISYVWGLNGRGLRLEVGEPGEVVKAE